MIGRQQLEERLKLLQTERARSLQSIAMIDGAIADVNHWLAELDKADQAEQSAAAGEQASTPAVPAAAATSPRRRRRKE